jgi:D-arginine dehydrogenase
VGPARIVVIGGGIAGVSVAAELATSAAVILLEAETALAHHTTGRSAAMYLPGYGNAVVRTLTLASRVDFDALSDEAGTPILTPRATMWVGGPDDDAVLRSLAAENEVVRRIDGDEVVARCPHLRRDRIGGGVVDDAGSDIDVGVLHQAYVRRLTGAGGTIERSARVTAIERLPAGGWRVSAGARTWDADLLVDAAGAWADEVAVLAGQRPVGLRPLRRTLFTSPVAAEVAPSPLVVDAQERWYVRVDAGVALVSPADETPSPPCDARPEELDVARALEAVNEVSTLGLRSVRTAWAGLRTFAPDRSPVAGPPADDPTFAWSAGQGGYGLQMAPALARSVAALALGQPLPPDVPLDPAHLSPDRFSTP